jgi:hypothetical protein
MAGQKKKEMLQKDSSCGKSTEALLHEHEVFALVWGAHVALFSHATTIFESSVLPRGSSVLSRRSIRCIFRLYSITLTRQMFGETTL